MISLVNLHKHMIAIHVFFKLLPLAALCFGYFILERLIKLCGDRFNPTVVAVLRGQYPIWICVALSDIWSGFAIINSIYLMGYVVYWLRKLGLAKKEG